MTVQLPAADPDARDARAEVSGSCRCAFCGHCRKYHRPRCAVEGCECREFL